MGKVILCTGNITDTPYVFAMSNSDVYSIEEMSYYLYTHIYEITEEFLDQRLIDWIRIELRLPELADKLTVMKLNRNCIKDIVVTILCSNDYYTEKEIKQLIEIMDAIKGLPAIKKKKIRGDYFLRYGLYYNASVEYERILNDHEVAEFSPEEYGNLLHNMGIIKVHTTSYYEAAAYFKEAYNLNHAEQTLIQYMLCILLSGDMKLYEEELTKYERTEVFTEQLYGMISAKEQEAKEALLYKKVQALKEIKMTNPGGYYPKAEELLEGLKQGYRKHVTV